MNHATKATKPKTSRRGKSREFFAVIVRLIMMRVLVRMAQAQELQGAFKELVDLFLSDFLRGEERRKVEVRESSIRHTRRQKLAQAARIDGTEVANFFEDDAAQRVLKNARLEQATDFPARASLDQEGAQEAQRIRFQKRPASACGGRHRVILLCCCRGNLVPNQRFDS